ncbi:MAG: hypothetical protein A4S09_09780 [Proteobacteria bacterium SG_bin7]|nr:MAG: hypothetical protein A4S09_09780 [Proteobacteria bacterium SG_bin7]
MVKVFTSLVFVFAVISAGFLFVQNEKDTHKNNLRIYAYSSFAKSWSAGPEIAKTFEEAFASKVEIVDAGDSAIMLQKLKIDPLPIDLVIGLDQDSFSDENLNIGWKKIEASDLQNNKIKFSPGFSKNWWRSDFLVFDWAPLTFILRKNKINSPRSWDELLGEQYKKSITLPDPRTSNLGWQFIKWIVADKGEGGAISYLRAFKSQIFSAPPSWSSAYGLFQSGQSQLSFSYLTSLLYHRWEEKKENEFEAAIFSSGHPVQVEYLGIPNKCSNCELAQKFAYFVLQDQIQKIFLHKNYMFPVVEVSDKTDLEILPKVKIRENLTEVSLATKQKMLANWIDLWK